MCNLFDCYRNLKKNRKYCFVNRGNIYVKGLGLRTTYFVERYDHEVKTLGQHTSVSQGSVLPANTRSTSEQAHNHKSTCAITRNTQTGSTSIATSLWSAPNFSTHLGPAICDNLPIAS